MNKKILLIGPSNILSCTNADYYKQKIKDGYQLVAFSVAIYYLRSIGIKPHYWSFVDPNTICSWGDNLGIDDESFFDQREYFKDINLLIMDLYYNDMMVFKHLGWSCTHAEGRKPVEFSKFKLDIDNGNFYRMFKRVYKYQPEMIHNVSKDWIHTYTYNDSNDCMKEGYKDECYVKSHLVDIPFKDENMTPEECTIDKWLEERFDYRDTLGWQHFQNCNSDKLTSYLLPLILKHFNHDIEEIETIGFGDTTIGRIYNSKNISSIRQYRRWFLMVFNYYKKYFKRVGIDFRIESFNGDTSLPVKNNYRVIWDDTDKNIKNALKKEGLDK